ncbi:MAG: hypothetical protein H0W28_01515 [Pyrinomonadaceae bacterium]|jgi:tetratricopeptide (TPR) repeat protein|nr:hypothetical protein [Pyrinomonadaceae bacterium]
MEYNRALALNPRFGIAVFHLGNTYVQMGRYGAALEQYRRGIQIKRLLTRQHLAEILSSKLQSLCVTPWCLCLELTAFFI